MLINGDYKPIYNWSLNKMDVNGDYKSTFTSLGGTTERSHT